MLAIRLSISMFKILSRRRSWPGVCAGAGSPPRISAPYQEEKRKGFVGRRWLFEDVRAWAFDTNPQAPQALLIAAG
jgi:hypothetical protein